jgi:hypothetical protein
LYLTTHVDDFKIVVESREIAQSVLDELKTKFEIKDLGSIKHYLGTDVCEQDNGIFLSQRQYIDDLLSSFRMTDAHPTRTPLDVGTIIDDKPDPNINIKEYQRGTGSLQYLATKTRPDICRAACLLAEHSASPTKKCWTALMHVLRYLKGTKNLGLQYSRGTGNLSMPLAYTDSDWGGPHTDRRRSVGGYVFLLAGAPISWQSKKQTCIALSSNEAEYIAASEASREAWWIRQILTDMDLVDKSDSCIPVHTDNKGAIDLTTAISGTKRSKHIDIRFHFTRDMAGQGIILIRQIPTTDMVADGLTKPLATDAHTRFLRQLGMSR